MNRRIFSLVLLFGVALFVSGCAAHRAANQPTRKDTSVLEPGTARDRVIAALGKPVSSEKYEGGKNEIYTFIQGYSKTARTGRAFFHGAADILTIGLWEIVGSPVEDAYTGKLISVRVIFGQD